MSVHHLGFQAGAEKSESRAGAGQGGYSRGWGQGGTAERGCCREGYGRYKVQRLIGQKIWEKLLREVKSAMPQGTENLWQIITESTGELGKQIMIVRPFKAWALG